MKVSEASQPEGYERRWRDDWMVRWEKGKGGLATEASLRWREGRVVVVISWSASCQPTTPLEANYRGVG